MYNHDLIGSRYNPGETAIGRSNAGRLVEKWRFPAKGSDQQIGVIHATPDVVDGYVYFGTATDPTFYKLAPDGKLCWAYRKPTRSGRAPGSAGGGRGGRRTTSGSSPSSEGIIDLGPGDRGHRLLRRPGRLVLRARPRDRQGAVEGRRAGRGLPRRPPDRTSSSPRRSSPTAS